jgi:hypothetical protein
MRVMMYSDAVAHLPHLVEFLTGELTVHSDNEEALDQIHDGLAALVAITKAYRLGGTEIDRAYERGVRDQHSREGMRPGFGDMGG